MGSAPRRRRRLGRLPEIHAAAVALIGAGGVLLIPPAGWAGPGQGGTHCGWFGWIGVPSVVCPGESFGERALELVANLPVYPANAAVMLALLPGAPSAWPALLAPGHAVGLVQLLLLGVLVKRGVAAGLARLGTRTPRR